jgi:hypothetical protein
VCDAITWETGAGPQRYVSWGAERKSELQAAFDAFGRGDTVDFGDPVPNALTPGDADVPATAFAPADAWRVYLAYLGHSLALDASGAVTWRLDDYDDRQLELLLASRSLFRLDRGSYELGVTECRSVPAPPAVAWQFLQGNGIIDASRRETTGRLLDWCRGMSHFAGQQTTATMEQFWGYRGWPPASRVIAGTVASGERQSEGRRHWTFGCWGTAGFLRTVLRAANVPCTLAIACPGPHQHALPHFPAEKAYLSHGDDPYASTFKAMADVPGVDLLIDEATFQAWFGRGVAAEQNCANVGRQVWQLGLEELWRAEWTAGWTSLVPLELGGSAHYLAYKIGDGEVNVDRVRPNAQGTDTIWGASWATGWSSFVPFLLDGKQHYLAYKTQTGEVAIDRVRPDGNGVDTIWGGSWTPGWSSFVPLTLDGKPHYLAYKVETGEVNVDRIRPDATGVDTIQATSFTPGWTAFAPLLVDAKPGYAAVKRATGELAADRVAVDGTIDARWAGNEEAGWTLLLPYAVRGAQNLMLYNAGTGALRIIHLRPNVAAKGVGHEFSDQWSPGWTSFARLEVDGRPLLLTYKGAEGTVTLNRLFG